MSQEFIIFVAISVTVVLIMWLIAEAVFGKNRKLKKRTKALCQRLGTEIPDMPVNSNVLKDENGSSSNADQLVRKLLPSTKVLQKRLNRAGMQTGTSGFIGINSAIGAVGGLCLFTFAGLTPLLSLLGGIVIGIGGAHLAIDVMIARRKMKFTNQFPDAIDLIVRTVKSGLPVTEGMAIVSTEIEGPVGEEFQKITETIKIGETMDQALWQAAERLDNSEFNFFVISLVVQSETGGNLAETLENLSDILRQRQTMKLKIKALASEARASAYILGSLPFVMMAILEVMSPGYTEPLFTDDTGIMLTVAALISICFGVGVMAKMVRFEI